MMRTVFAAGLVAGVFAGKEEEKKEEQKVKLAHETFNAKSAELVVALTTAMGSAKPFEDKKFETKSKDTIQKYTCVVKEKGETSAAVFTSVTPMANATVPATKEKAGTMNADFKKAVEALKALPVKKAGGLVSDDVNKAATNLLKHYETKAPAGDGCCAFPCGPGWWVLWVPLGAGLVTVGLWAGGLLDDVFGPMFGSDVVDTCNDALDSAAAQGEQAVQTATGEESSGNTEEGGNNGCCIAVILVAVGALAAYYFLAMKAGDDGDESSEPEE